MINHKLVSKVLGILLFIEAGLLLSCLIMALAYREDDTIAFMITIGLTTITGLICLFAGNHAENNMSRRDAYLIVSLTWVIFSLFGMLPFLISGYLTNVADAFLETMSGFTTTGATVINDVSKLPHGLLFWRSLTHWIGGLGIVFFTIAILPSFVTGDVRLFAAEATGPTHNKLQPRISSTAKWIWMIYLLLTAGCTISLILAGMNWFDSINHSFATTATGGFSTNRDSIRGYNNPAIEYIEIVFMFLSGVNFTLIYLSIIKVKIKRLFNSSEFKFYLFLVLASSAFIAFLLVLERGYDIEHAIRSGLFQVVSLITTTGFYSDNIGLWPHITWVVLCICMYIGSCAGSTCGGLKCIRAVMLIKITRNEFKHILHPNAVLPVRIDGRIITNSVQTTLLAFFTSFTLLILISSMAMICMHVNYLNAITISLSSISNVGPAIGTQIGPTESWSALPDAAKWISSALMLIGRLEIFSVIVLFTRGFWKDH
jgi:trk system potassium uptake protein